MSTLKQKALKALRLPYWMASSFFSKKQFLLGTKTTYQFLDDVFYRNKDEFYAAMNNASKVSASYWQHLEKFDYNTHFPQRYAQQEKMLLSDFIPLFPSKPVIADIGAAEGEWAAKVAPYCQSIDAFEYSQKMVDFAMSHYGGIDNIHFTQGDARCLKFSKQYNGAMMLGVLTYISNDSDASKIINNVYSSIKVGGYLVTKDTLSREELDVVYLFNAKTGYDATYRSQEVYYSLFERQGFKLIKEVLLEDGKNSPIFRYSRGAIWSKE